MSDEHAKLMKEIVAMIERLPLLTLQGIHRALHLLKFHNEPPTGRR
jgi:hypothetical protein